uniref:Uncharacterized protein n=1 Tax=Moniliophthora roreri TaxID=221103 RepID=A0A0W0FZN5_MONRR
MADMHNGQAWHQLKTGIRHEIREFGAVHDVPKTKDTDTRMTSKRFVLHLVANLDWFGAKESRPHSTGPIYMSISDLPCPICFLQPHIICLMITPGLSEPTTEQMNNCAEPLICEICALKEGVKMEMYDENDEDIVEEDVFSDLVCNNCDTPGAQKFSGLAGHTSDMNPCYIIDGQPLTFNLGLVFDQLLTCVIAKKGFKLRDKGFMLKQKFFSKNEPHHQEEILACHGVQFSILDWIPGWQPTSQTALDFMHCVVAWLFTRILFAAHMFYGAGPTSGCKRFKLAINSTQWPSHITCLPKNRNVLAVEEGDGLAVSGVPDSDKAANGREGVDVDLYVPFMKSEGPGVDSGSSMRAGSMTGGGVPS